MDARPHGLAPDPALAFPPSDRPTNPWYPNLLMLSRLHARCVSGTSSFSAMPLMGISLLVASLAAVT